MRILLPHFSWNIFHWAILSLGITMSHLWWNIFHGAILCRGRTLSHFSWNIPHWAIADSPISGRLPAIFHDSVTIKHLFQNRSLLAYPSILPGMDYVLSSIIDGHQLHLGLREGKPVVRALFRGAVLELIPPDKFRSDDDFDLPHSLIDNCVHWLDLHTRKVEIRQPPNIWRSTAANWKLDLDSFQAHRGNSTLVNPQSKTFQAIAKIFAHFESPHHLTVVQPEERSLSVELRRLELSFFVNAKGWLESPQLRAEINDNREHILLSLCCSFEVAISRLIILTIRSCRRCRYLVWPSLENYPH